ncbi:MAG TPA: epoxyqueuosine reductase [Candidatus Omnitrophota bacterium]|nr:epoxyqueuosine reductase [Candidatus Omnitrophota bacterium]HPS19709.1 epoxyqueuosine reductase [Candidatus Omnitrophota bacterium]
MRETEIKDICLQAGADLVGIASAEKFGSAPKGFHPKDVMPTCRSVIVLGCEFPKTALDKAPAEYTKIRNETINKVAKVLEKVAAKIKEAGSDVYPVGEGTKIGENGRYHGTISFKHAAELAGIGKIGRNTLLVNKTYGNMIWFGAVLTALVLESDAPAEYAPCNTSCGLCVENCPARALGDEMMDQKACLGYAFKKINGAPEIQCWRCREVCPHHLGTKENQTVGERK